MVGAPREVDQKYLEANVIPQRNLPAVNPQLERIRLMMAVHRERERKEREEKLRQEQDNKLDRQIEEAFRPGNEYMVQGRQRAMQAMDNNRQNFDAQVGQLRPDIEHLEREELDFAAGNRNLEQAIQNAQQSLNEAQKDSLDLQRLVEKIQHNNKKKRRKKALQSGLKVVAVIGACGLATWALTGVAASAGSSVKLVALPIDRGIKVAAKTPFL